MKNIFLQLILLVCLSTPTLYSQENSKIELDLLIEKIEKLEEEEKYAEAKTLTENSFEKYPDGYYKLSRELVYINTKLENTAANLEIWQEGHRRGYFYGLFPQFYRQYAGFAWFDSLSRADMDLRGKAMEKSVMKYEIIYPPEFNRDEKYPAIFIFHGGGSTNKKSIKYWRSELLDSKFVKIFIQSYIYYGCEEFGWGRINERITADFDKIRKELEQLNLNIDENKIFYGGISAGVLPSIDFAINSKYPAPKVIGVCPAINPDRLEQAVVEKIKEKKSAIYIITGEEDGMLENQKKLADKFLQNQIEIEMTILKNTGHRYPDNFEQMLNDYLVKFFKDN